MCRNIINFKLKIYSHRTTQNFIIYIELIIFLTATLLLS